MQARVDKALDCLKHYNAYVKMISSTVSDDSNWQKLVDVLSDPEKNRPFKSLKPNANRTLVWDFATNQYVRREITRERGSYKKDATHGPKASVTLAPPNGKMKYFYFENGYAIGIMFAGDKLDFKQRSDGKLGRKVFTKNASTNNKPWISGQLEDGSLPPDAVDIDGLVAFVKDNHEKGVITYWNEAMAGLCKEAAVAIFTPHNTVSDRLNALCRQQFIKSKLGLDLPILIMPSDADVSVYTIDQQIDDILIAIKRNKDNVAYQFLHHIDVKKLSYENYKPRQDQCDLSVILKLNEFHFSPIVVMLLEANPQLIEDFMAEDNSLLIWAILLNCTKVKDWLPKNNNQYFHKIMDDPELFKIFSFKLNSNNLAFFNANAYYAIKKNPLIRQLALEGILSLQQLSVIHYQSTNLNTILKLSEFQAELKKGSLTFLERLHTLTDKEVTILESSNVPRNNFIHGMRTKYLTLLNFEQISNLVFSYLHIFRYNYICKAVVEDRFSIEELCQLKSLTAINAIKSPHIFQYLLSGKLTIVHLNALNGAGLIALNKVGNVDWLFIEALSQGLIQIEDVNDFTCPTNSVVLGDLSDFFKLYYEKYGRERLYSYITLAKNSMDSDPFEAVIIGLFKRLPWISIVVLDQTLIISLLKMIPGMINHQFGTEANTLLHLACSAGQFELVKELLTFPDIKVNIERTDQSSALYLASKHPAIHDLFIKSSIHHMESLQAKLNSKVCVEEDVKQLVMSVHNEVGYGNLHLILDEIEKAGDLLLYIGACSQILLLLLDNIANKEFDKKLFNRVIVFSIDKFDLDKQCQPRNIIETKISQYHSTKNDEAFKRVNRLDNKCPYKALLFPSFKTKVENIIQLFEISCANKWFLFDDSRIRILDQITVLKRLILASKSLDGLLSRLMYFVEVNKQVSFMNVPFHGFIAAVNAEVKNIMKIQPLTYVYNTNLFAKRNPILQTDSSQDNVYPYQTRYG